MSSTIGIIGGGLSGTLVAIKILQHYKQPVQVVIFEHTPERIFRGIAYSSALKFQPLNVRASQMNITESNASDFYQWLEKKWRKYFSELPASSEFVRRDVFGDYLHESFQMAAKNASENHSIKIVYDEVTEINNHGDRLELITASEKLKVDYTVLALGNFLPGDLPIQNTSFYKSNLYQANPWDTNWMNNLKEDDEVLFLGSGLTTVDQVINLLNSNHRGKIKILSRRGFMPKAHKVYKPITLPPLDVYLGISISEVVAQVRRQIAKYGDWRNVIDNIRTQVPLIWSYLSLEERKRFLRHVRPFWEVHRHRIPEESLTILGQDISNGRIEIISGRVLNIVQQGERAIVHLRSSRTFAKRELHVTKVINCTGPQTDYRKIDQPLIQNLMKKEWLHADELNLGLAVNRDGQLINSEGEAIKNIFTIGSLRKGAMWECTALREIALQAHQLVSKLNAEAVCYVQ